MTIGKWMMLGLLLGFAASSGASCGSSSKACGPKDCPFGCCDATGACQVGSSDSQCGAQGTACSACGIAQRCNLGICNNIGSGNGPGGGNGGGTTGGGGGATGGGSGGGGVTGGGGGSASCGPSNCAGCCMASGFCIQPPNNTASTACGASGNACADCAAASASCNASTHSCQSSTGGGGGGSTGGGGGSTGGGGGSASCGPSNCAGCCLLGFCVDAPNNVSSSACGRLGMTCVDCTATGGSCSSTSYTCTGGVGGGGGATGGGGGSTGGGTGGAGGGFAGGETCTSPIILPGPGTYDDTTATAVDDYQFGDTGLCQGSSNTSGSGPDKVYRVSVAGNATLDVTVTPTDPDFDAIANLVDASGAACGGSSGSGLTPICLDGADDPEPIILTWTNPTATTALVLILVDGYNSLDTGTFTLTYTVTP